MSFRKLQSIIDLRRAVIGQLERVAPTPSTVEFHLLKVLQQSISERVPNWKLELDPEIYREVSLKAVSADEDDLTFLTASCVLLLDRLENSERGSDFQWEWDAFAARYRNADPVTRAAIMNGLEQGRKHGVVSGGVRPTISDCTTKPVQEVVKPLCKLAKSLTAEEREYISNSDYGEDVERHLSALNQLLQTEDCLYPSGEVWFPAEVVELVSHSSTDPGYVGCTAILLINAIADGDDQSNAEFRWRSQRFSYDALKPSPRRSILDGFRHIYEVNRDWDPYSDQFAPERLQTDSFLLA